MIPAGQYKAVAQEWGFTTANTGNNQLAIEFVVVDGEAKGQVVYGFLYFTDNALPYTLASLYKMGYADEPLNVLGLGPKGEGGGGNLNKNQVILVVEHEEHEGKMRAKVKYINALDEEGGRKPLERNPLQGNALDKFSNSMQARMQIARQKLVAEGKVQVPATGAAKPAVNKPPPPRKPAAGAAGAAPPDDDNIDF